MFFHMVTIYVREKLITLRKFEKCERLKNEKTYPLPEEMFWTAGGRPEGVTKYVGILFYSMRIISYNIMAWETF